MQKHIEASITFREYDELVERLLAEGKTTGENQSEDYVNYTKLNQHRMARLEKTTVLTDSLRRVVEGLRVDWIWLTLTEGWCGDAAQNIPIIEKIAAANPNINSRYLLRDENLDLMDQYLTNGGRSIPKLICLDAQGREIGTWGPRPQAAIDLFNTQKAAGLEKPQIIENIQRWYLDDKGASLQAEFETLLPQWAAKRF